MHLFWDDGDEGVPQGELVSGATVSINTFPGHAFIWKSEDGDNTELHRTHIEAGVVSYDYDEREL
jgi:hypothetical protein